MPEIFENKAKFAANSWLLARTSTQLSDISGVRSEFMIRSALPKTTCSNRFPGAHRDVVPPDSIPNSEVKRVIADGSVADAM